MKKIVNIPNSASPVGPYSQAVFHNNILYSSGQIAICPITNNIITNSIKEETNQVMKNIETILKNSNMTFDNVIKCSIFISDMNDFKEINEIYSSYFNDSLYPARETVEVSCLPKNVNIEISFIAGA